jgi:Cysteine dioxygenase type I
MTRAIHVDHLAVARSFAAEPYEWPMAPRFNPARRWYIRIADAPGYRVWLQTWLPGQATDLHQHAEPGAIYVCRGELHELVAPDGSGAPPPARSLPSGSGVRLDGAHRHRIENRGALPAVSVYVCCQPGRDRAA